MFRSVLYYFCAFGTVRLCYKTQCETGQTDAKVRATKSRRNFRRERTPSTPLHSKLMFWCVLYYLDAFGPFGCLTKLNAKRAELVQKFVPRSRVLSFRMKHTRLSPLGPKLIFGVFRTIWVHLVPFGYLTKLGAKRAEVVQNFVP